MNRKNGVSIIICCYNSISRLKSTLEHIARQKVSKDIPWEVIIINNNSSDGTGEYAKQIWKTLDCNVPFNIVFESQSGLSFAREKGINTAQYEYILFCDDDNWLCDSFIQNVYYIFNSNPQVGLIGSRNESVSLETLPKWFDSVKVYYAIGSLYPKSEELYDLSKAVFGAGMALRKKAYLELKEKGFKFQLADRKGKNLSSGGDLELRIVLGLIDYTCYYSNELYLQHFIPTERLNKKYAKKLAFEWGKVVFLLSTYHHYVKREPISRLYFSLRLLKNGTLLIPFSIRSLFKGFRGYCDLLTRIGTFYAQVTDYETYFALRKKHERLFKNRTLK